jgi:hypothetical protein
MHYAPGILLAVFAHEYKGRSRSRAVVRYCSATPETFHLVLDRDVIFAAWAPSLNAFICPLVLPNLVSLRCDVSIFVNLIQQHVTYQPCRRP